MAIYSDALARSPGLKFLLVGVLAVAMSVPLFFVYLALVDRQTYAQTATSDIARGWGGYQMVGGPALAVPYITTETRQASDGTTSTVDVRRIAIFLPKTIDVTADTKTETRARGIFAVNVYTGDITLRGTFGTPDFSELNIVPKEVQWDRAQILLPITDLQGLSENVDVKWGAAKTVVPFKPGLLGELSGQGGINARVVVAPDSAETPFEIVVRLRGSGTLSFTAVGETTTVTATGNWPHPSFQGNFLPVTREITSTGFTATWKVPHLARNLAQSMATPDNLALGLSSASFGVAFYQPVNFYQLVQRALKYAILFVGFAFLSFFLIETLSGARIHGVQYLLIGAAQVVFYLLLLSLSEQIGFDLAYMFATAATVGLTSLYAWSALKSWSGALIVFGVLSALYALLFLLLKQEDYALVIGSSAAFAAIAVTMYVTRNIDWYRATEKANRE
jgi:inner membrane protein